MIQSMSIQQVFERMKEKGTEVAGPFTWGQLLDRYPTYAKVNKILCEAVGIPDFDHNESFEVPVPYLNAILEFETAKSVDDIIDLYKVMCTVLIDSIGDVYADIEGFDDDTRSRVKTSIQFVVMEQYPTIDAALKSQFILQ